ncbi:MAG: hypothetical protein GX444_14785 [Myxococcales bacterium]|nr:hypothetical protein [Myxococcales bacterium]
MKNNLPKQTEQNGSFRIFLAPTVKGVVDLPARFPGMADRLTRKPVRNDATDANPRSTSLATDFKGGSIRLEHRLVISLLCFVPLFQEKRNILKRLE